MTGAHPFLKAIGLPSRDLGELPASLKRFPDGAQYRIEKIPNVEAPGALEAALAAGKEFDVPIHPVSQRNHLRPRQRRLSVWGWVIVPGSASSAVPR